MRRLAPLVAALLVLGVSGATCPPVNAGEMPNLRWDPQRHGRHTRDMFEEATGRIWIATEDHGIIVFDPRTGAETIYNRDNGLPENSVLALAVDALGRVWAGHGSRGVSVFNGERWRNYGHRDGPIGDRVRAIACDANGVWMASNLGLAYYDIDADRWQFFCAANGLPDSVLTAVTVDQAGRVYIGSMTGGVFWTQPKRSESMFPKYAWQSVPLPQVRDYRWQASPYPRPPIYRARGKGLPGGMVNALATAPDGTVYAATFCGLAYGKDGDLRYVRGKDLPRIISGYNGPTAQEVENTSHSRTGEWWKNRNESAPRLTPIQEAPDLAPADLPLIEDYVSCVTVDMAGNLYLGHRNSGYESVSPAPEFAARFSHLKEVERFGNPNLAKYLLPLAGGGLIVGWYNRELQIVAPAIKTGRKYLPFAFEPSTDARSFPSPAAAPGHELLAGLCGQLSSRAPLAQTLGATGMEDWQTQGDWMGRYGRQLAIVQPQDIFCWTGEQEAFGIKYYSGRVIGDVIRAGTPYFTWYSLSATDDRRRLYNPAKMLRQSGEVNGKGLGPNYVLHFNLFVDFRLPAGTFKLALYFEDPNKIVGKDAYRDMPLTIYRRDGTPILRDRVHDAQDGVYKNYILAGNKEYTLVIERAGDFNAVLNGLFIDEISKGTDSLTPQERLLPGLSDTQWLPPACTRRDAQKCWKLYDKLIEYRRDNGAGTTGATLARLLLRQAHADGATAETLAHFTYLSGVQDENDRIRFRQNFDNFLRRRAAHNPELTR